MTAAAPVRLAQPARKSRFAEATRSNLKARIALTGGPGDGKTYTALAIATLLVGARLPPAEKVRRIAVIDSERGSAARYCKGQPFDFSTLVLSSFSPESYLEAIRDAASEGFEVIIIDSLSHEWMGTDGAMEQVDRAKSKSGSSAGFSAWLSVTPRHNAVVDAIMSSPAHVIATLRSKMGYEIGADKKPVKIGLQAIQRDGTEYEFDIVAAMSAPQTMTITKTRCEALTEQVFRGRPHLAFTEILAGWLGDGAPGEPPAPPPPVAKPSPVNMSYPQPDEAPVSPAPVSPAPVSRELTPAQLGALEAERVARLPSPSRELRNAEHAEGAEARELARQAQDRERAAADAVIAAGRREVHGPDAAARAAALRADLAAVCTSTEAIMVALQVPGAQLGVLAPPLVRECLLRAVAQSALPADLDAVRQCLVAHETLTGGCRADVEEAIEAHGAEGEAAAGVADLVAGVLASFASATEVRQVAAALTVSRRNLAGREELARVELAAAQTIHSLVSPLRGAAFGEAWRQVTALFPKASLSKVSPVAPILANAWHVATSGQP